MIQINNLIGLPYVYEGSTLQEFIYKYERFQYFNIRNHCLSAHCTPEFNMNNLSMLMIIMHNQKVIMHFVPYEHPPIFYGALLLSIEQYLSNRFSAVSAWKFIFHNVHTVRFIIFQPDKNPLEAICNAQELFLALLDAAHSLFLWHAYYSTPHISISFNQYSIPEDHEYYSYIIRIAKIKIRITQKEYWWNSLFEIYIRAIKPLSILQPVEYTGYCSLRDRLLTFSYAFDIAPLQTQGFIYAEYTGLRLLSNTRVYNIYTLVTAFTKPLCGFINQKNKITYAILQDGVTFYFTDYKQSTKIILITEYYHVVINDYNNEYIRSILYQCMQIALSIQEGQKHNGMLKFFENEFQLIKNTLIYLSTLKKNHAHIPITPPIIYSTYRGAEWW